MVINISDDLDPKERHRLLQLLPIVYALNKVGTKQGAANFLGISCRCLRNNIKRYPEYFKIKVKQEFKSLEQKEGYMDMLRRYPDEV